jgi:hypothetical protein
MNFLVDLSREELELLILEYDRYIQQANDEDYFESGWRPVCLMEFLGAEFQMILDDLEAQAAE